MCTQFVIYFSFQCKEKGREFEIEPTQFNVIYSIYCDQDDAGNPFWSSDKFPICNCKFINLDILGVI